MSLLKLARKFQSKYAQTNQTQKEVEGGLRGLLDVHLLVNGNHPGAALFMTTKELQDLLNQAQTSTLMPQVISGIEEAIRNDYQLIKTALNDH